MEMNYFEGTSFTSVDRIIEENGGLIVAATILWGTLILASELFDDGFKLKLGPIEFETK